MKKLGAVLFVAGAFIAGGAALAMAGPGDKYTICHLPSDRDVGHYILISASAWRTSPHSMHGDCRYYGPDFVGEKEDTEAADVIDEEGEVIGCRCQPVWESTEPDPNDPAPAP
ncbi:MAG: hypothetical protein IPM54_27130 [Polyangiaceae bacterium]|nr:hypothetical protein [Polyangiaceae bacterium]